MGPARKVRPEQNFTLQVAVFLAATALTVPRAFADGDGMVRPADTPEQIGTIWGEINKEATARDIEGASYLKRATVAGISSERERLKEEWKARIGAGNPERAHVEMMEQWSQTHADKLMAALQE